MRAGMRMGLGAVGLRIWPGARGIVIWLGNMNVAGDAGALGNCAADGDCGAGRAAVLRLLRGIYGRGAHISFGKKSPRAWAIRDRSGYGAGVMGKQIQRMGD